LGEPADIRFSATSVISARVAPLRDTQFILRGPLLHDVEEERELDWLGDIVVHLRFRF